eukprot:CAMPEP_0177672230 /NCGR_PEP_ID=MMETSP0447-20121125/25206_1 /TAXON_ID=0 /ORGANISM="Stygamoeba regulata, Strain BSH-02190019" /LENGTH=31 /DNA_ID= /DNA_START= /DNA_END= /DNA_ORIENTATION=
MRSACFLGRRSATLAEDGEHEEAEAEEAAKE